MTPIKMRGIARRFIPEMLQMGWTTTKGLDYLRGQGLGYRRRDFLADWREFEGRERKRDPLKAIPKKFKPTWDTIEKAEYVQRAKFNYTFEVKGFDIVQQKDVTEWVTVASETLLTMEEAEEMAEYLAEKYKMEITDAKTIVSAVTARVG